MKGKNKSTDGPLYTKRVGDVLHLVFYAWKKDGSEVIVFVDKDLDLDWEYNDKAAQDLDEYFRKMGKIQNGVSVLEPQAQNWPSDLKIASKRLLGEAIASVLRLDEEGASLALENARSFFKEKSTQVSRYWTLQGCVAATVCAAILGIGAIILKNPICWFLGTTFYTTTLCFSSGCVGAFLFVVLQFEKGFQVDSSAERSLHFWESGARIVVGGIAGILVAGMVSLGLVLPSLNNADNRQLGLCVASMIAGASERFVRGIITKSTSSKKTEKEDSK